MRRIVRCASRDGRNDRFRHRAAAGTVEPMAERRLYLVRHGAASGDGDDAELTSLGERQSDAIGRRLADVALTGVYHSPSRRAAQTAALIAGHLGGATPIESSLVADVIPSNPPRAALPASVHGVPRPVQRRSARSRPDGRSGCLGAIRLRAARGQQRVDRHARVRRRLVRCRCDWSRAVEVADAQRRQCRSHDNPLPNRAPTRIGRLQRHWTSRRSFLNPLPPPATIRCPAAA